MYVCIIPHGADVSAVWNPKGQKVKMWMPIASHWKSYIGRVVAASRKRWLVKLEACVSLLATEPALSIFLLIHLLA
jgi:hypothetical protein